MGHMKGILISEYISSEVRESDIMAILFIYVRGAQVIVPRPSSPVELL